MRRFLYIVPENARAHSHIHAVKIRALTEMGWRAERIVLCPRGAPPLETAPNDVLLNIGYNHLAGLSVARYVWAILKSDDVVVQTLRVPPLPAAVLRKAAMIRGRRFRYVAEFEGDSILEADYLARHPYRKGFYDSVLRYSQRTARQQRRQALRADGLVLRSEEHIRLWEGRLGRRTPALDVPDLFDSDRMHFDPAARVKIRERLGLNGRIVLAYCGNVLCSWQRFGSVCRMVRRLRDSGENVFLIALVRAHDHPIAKDFIGRNAIESETHLTHVAPEEVAAYLSAADMGLFLRLDHPMNRIVTSAKLGEYFACGLPVITTGIAALFPDFIRERGCGIFVDATDPASTLPPLALKSLAAKGGDVEWRRCLAEVARRRFSNIGPVMERYIRFIEEQLD